MNSGTRRICVFSYHFPHYRVHSLRAVLSLGYPTVFIGDKNDPYNEGVESWVPAPGENFLNASCVQPIKRLPLLWQRGIVKHAFFQPYDALIVYSHMYVFSYWFVPIVARLRGKRVALWGHGWRTPKSGLEKLLRKLFYKLYNEHLVFSDQAREHGIQEGFDPKRIHVIYNCLDVPEQNKLYERITARQLDDRRNQLFSDKYPVIVCMTRLIKLRNLPLLFEAAALLKEKQRPVNLLIVGDGPERAALEKMSAQMGIITHFAGACYKEEELAEYFMLSTLTVSPGPIGLMAMHSMVYGVPVVSNDDSTHQGPEWHAIAPGKNGDLFSNDNAQSLAEKIVFWAFDRTDRDVIAENCRQTVLEKYNPGYQATIFNRVINSPD